VRRSHWLDRINELDPKTDFVEIYRIMTTLEFPWDMVQSLSFALFRAFAVPSIGSLLAQTGAFTTDTQKRYVDTVLILNDILEFDIDARRSRTSQRRVNQMHGAYDISNDDFRYVLSTFVVVPDRWLAEYGWRPLSANEHEASVHYYAQMGRRMNIKDIPETFEDFATLMDSYECANFGYDADARRVADATIQLIVKSYPHAAARFVRRGIYALMDPPLLAALGYPAPSSRHVASMQRVMHARAAAVRRLPPRKTPRYPRQDRMIRKHASEYDVTTLGTFPDRVAKSGTARSR